MKFGWTLALVCLVIGVNANAATLHTNSAGDGSSLFLTVWNGADKSIVIDLGVDASTANFATLTYSGDFSTQLNAAFGGVSTNFLYSVVAVSNDALSQGIWTTHTSGSLLPYDIVSSSGTLAGKLTNYANGNPLAALSALGCSGAACATNGPAGVGPTSGSPPTNNPGYYNNSNFQGTLGGTFPGNMGGNVGTSLFFYSLLNNFDLNNFSNVANNTLYAGKWLLSQTGLLSYGGNAPIPLPAAVYMLGAALLGLVGIGRRNRVAATA
jgi:hypothetical protein